MAAVPRSTKLARVPGAVYKQTRRVLAQRYWARYFRRRPTHPALDEQRAAESVGEADRLLVLCWGNICRSPMAERYLRSALSETPAADLAVESAGLGEREGRPSPPLAVEAARRYGVDLSDHTSVCATESMVADSDCVLVMDYHNYHLLQSSHPSADAVFFLSAFSPVREPMEIRDPAGGDRETFDSIYGTIAAALDRLAAQVVPATHPR
ncbi:MULTISPECIES: hypothetical protein [Salinibaculum]|uniref:arsenate reductase/protein-tyrosine-phosphatase family protein n=1 Tax=Salinibaculum TaxID=2732368 RepID=UPI0030D293A3